MPNDPTDALIGTRLELYRGAAHAAIYAGIAVVSAVAFIVVR